MGYTHYWDTPKRISKANWKALTEHADRIIKASDVPVRLYRYNYIIVWFRGSLLFCHVFQQ